jgi:small multidrug resistance family-3 protein
MQKGFLTNHCLFREVEMSVPVSFGLFILAGLCEIGGGYLVWQSLRSGKPIWYGVLGGVILILYGVIPTFQPTHFGRVYAAYGGMFIILSLLWGWGLDGNRPDRYDTIGAALCLSGMAIIMYAPRA